MFSRFTRLLNRRSPGIGLEITPERLNIAQLTAQGYRYKLTKFAKLSIPEGMFVEGRINDPPALAAIIQDLLYEHNITAKQVATAVPLQATIIRTLPVPAELDDQELRDIVLNYEAALNLPYPRETVDLDYQKLGVFEDVDGIEKVQILLVAIRKEVTDSYLDTLQQAGLAVEVLDVNSFALIRTIREHLRTFGSEEAVVLINIEFDRTEISIIVNGVPHFSRTVTIGMLQMQQALALAMDLPPSRDPEILQGIAIPVTQFERFDSQAATVNPGIAALMQVLGELADELQRSLDFYLNESQGVEVVQLLLAGPGGGLVQLDEYFSQTLNIPTIKVDPLESLMIETEQSFSSIERPSLATVLGLGLRII